MSDLAYDLNSPDIYNPQSGESVPAAPLYDCQYKPGIYFGMPDEEYHAIHALSASGIKHLLVSSMDYWSQSWMNPGYVDTETDAKEAGTAYHTRILEGKAAFAATYAENFDASQYPDALDTAKDITAHLKAIGVKGYSGKDKAELVEILLEVEPNAQVLDVLKQEYRTLHSGKRFISRDLLTQIEKAAFMIERDPTASKCFTGGYPEVTIIWIDPETGVPMKARIDYLKLQAIIDLKSFSNPMSKPIDKAIYGAMATRKYHIQAATYMEADTYGTAHARAGRIFLSNEKSWLSCAAIGGGGEGRLLPTATLQTWLDSYMKHETRRFVFVFQQTGISPITRVREFPRNLVYDCGVAALRDAQRKYAECWKTYGTDPWIDVAPMKVFDDQEFPLYTTEV